MFSYKQKLATQWGIPFFETSSKSGHGIEEALSTFTNRLVEKHAYVSLSFSFLSSSRHSQCNQ
jgi:hypothetical protein